MFCCGWGIWKRLSSGEYLCSVWRVHGGGFAGTVQAFVPLALRDEFKKVMDGAFGENACSVLNIRPEGAIQIM